MPVSSLCVICRARAYHPALSAWLHTTLRPDVCTCLPAGWLRRHRDDATDPGAVGRRRVYWRCKRHRDLDGRRVVLSALSLFHVRAAYPSSRRRVFMTVQSAVFCLRQQQ
jgi:hypothetical protein